MISALNKLPDGTIELTITIPAELVKKTQEEVINEMVKNASLPGFRKGKAPKKLIEEKLDKETIREEVLKKLLPQTYLEAIKEHNLRPIINPKIHVNPDWQFTALTCEVPEILLQNYKEAIGKLTAKEKIIIPGKEPQKVPFEEIIKALLEAIAVKIPAVLTSGEVDRLLSQTLDEVKKLGLTLDQYLSSTGKTPEALRAEYQQKAESDIKLEFALQKIAEVEKIIVSEIEIEEAIEKAKSDEERKNLENNKYLLANILRQQKTLDFLRSL